MRWLRRNETADYGFVGGASLVAGRKRRWGDWHHRVPDFKLVYCGPKEGVSKKEIKLRGRRGKVSVNADEDDAAGRRLEQQKTLG